MPDKSMENDMTDKELLELAAKAGGIEGEYCEFHKHPECTFVCGIGDPARYAWGDYLWNSLNNDGDALRLAVKLCIRADMRTDVCFIEDWGVTVWSDECGNDLYAATRRAITRAAAEIGKGMNA